MSGTGAHMQPSSQVDRSRAALMSTPGPVAVTALLVTVEVTLRRVTFTP